uniref:Uncharacterized protein n=1 Tax=Oryza brachyantha TaxID=4533 RepID=J3NFF0_ORYBR
MKLWVNGMEWKWKDKARGLTERSEGDAEDEESDGVGDAGAAEEVAGGDAENEGDPDEEHGVIRLAVGSGHGGGWRASVLPEDWNSGSHRQSRELQEAALLVWFGFGSLGALARVGDETNPRGKRHYYYQLFFPNIATIGRNVMIR